MTSQELGKKIQELRKKHKISQTELSEALGVSQNRISEIENGRYDFSFGYYAKILNQLGYEFEIKLKD